VFEEQELRELGKVAEEHNLLILADEVVRLGFSLHALAWFRLTRGYD
jgi:bifunctional pyridoxal-dependent enzyme with beta-cystathionase and maltose regulon repressor activities